MFFSIVKSFSILYVVYRSTQFQVVLTDSDYPPACWWPCLCRKGVSDLRKLEKIWTFWGSQKWWTWCWNVLRIYMKEIVYTSIFVQSPGEESFMSFYVEFFQTWTRFRFEDSSFFYRNVCNPVPKLIWPRMDSYWSFCLSVPCFATVISAYPEVCKKCSILFLFCWHEVFPVINLGFFWSVLWRCSTF